MCLLVFAYRRHPNYAFIFAGNRDEFLSRPAAPMAFWETAPDLLAGRDLRGGGTWLGLTRSGRFASVTNVREPGRMNPAAPSRGALPVRFLLGTMTPEAYLDALAPEALRYNGFNLLLGDGASLWYATNRNGRHRLAPGLYGLSNDRLDTPWPKVVRGRERLDALCRQDRIDPEELFDLLTDPTPAPDDQLPDTGVGLAWERQLSPIFIRTRHYGTRVSTVLLIDRDGRALIAERTHSPDGAPPATRTFELSLPTWALPPEA